MSDKQRPPPPPNDGEIVERNNVFLDGNRVKRSPDSKANWKEKTIWTGDNLPIMRGMNSESVDLIYLDPPFNSKRDYAAPIGSEAAGAEFKDTWTLNDIDKEWIDLIKGKHEKLYHVILATIKNSDKSYLAYMAPRLIEMERILKPSGSIYLHCDATMSHSLKMMMDVIFKKGEFKREIIWNLQTASGYKSQVNGYIRGHDTILYYTKSKDEFVFNKQYKEHKPEYIARFKKVDNGRRYRDDRGGGRRQYLDETKGVALTDVWSDIMSFQQNATSKEITGFETQKPEALLQRIINASSNKGDLIFDPFCGCATTLVAADDLQRNWVGIDISPKAVELVKRRIKNKQKLFKDIISRDDIPQRSDMGKLPPPRYHLKTLYGEQEGYCNGCGDWYKSKDFEVDHITAKSKGGSDHIDNLQLLCSDCNGKKGDRGMEYLIQRLKLDKRELRL